MPMKSHLLLFCHLVLGALLFSKPTQADSRTPSFLTNGLVAHYTFTRNTEDQSGNNNHGSPYGPAKPFLCIDRFGVPDSAYEFTGGGTIKIPDNLVPRVPFTVTLWYLRTDRTGQQYNGSRVLVFFGAEGSLRDSTISCSADGFLGLYTSFTTDNWDGSKWVGDWGDGILNSGLLGRWNCIAITVDEEFSCSFHLNGTNIKTSRIPTSVGSPVLGTSNLRAHIGAFQGLWFDFDKTLSDGTAFIGRIDDVRFYNRALSDGEISAAFINESGERGARVATVSAQVVNGFVVGATVIDGGYGYTNSPVVSFTGGGGFGAKAIAQIDQEGSVTNVTIVEVGKNYSTPPKVVISSPAYPIAMAQAGASVVNGYVVGVDVYKGGWGYTNAPAVRLIGGGGSGAKATATINNNGVVTSIKVTAVGSGYLGAPAVVIEPPVVAELSHRLEGLGQALHFSNLDSTRSYELQVAQGDGFRSTGTVVKPSGGEARIHVDGNHRHRLVALPLPQIATASLQIVNGFVVEASILNGGSGYTTPPSVTVSDASGNGAVVTATLRNGAVSALSIISAGKGYSPSAKVQFTQPPVDSIQPKVTPAMKVSVSNLLPNFEYQIQTTTDLVTFRDFGAVFSASEPSQTFYLELTRDVELLRTVFLR
jgi:hypothetical protein